MARRWKFQLEGSTLLSLPLDVWVANYSPDDILLLDVDFSSVRMVLLIRHCRITQRTMKVLKRYVLRLFISLKYVTANVMARNHGRIVATASAVEHSIKISL